MNGPFRGALVKSLPHCTVSQREMAIAALVRRAAAPAPTRPGERPSLCSSLKSKRRSVRGLRGGRWGAAGAQAAEDRSLASSEIAQEPKALGGRGCAGEVVVVGG